MSFIHEEPEAIQEAGLNAMHTAIGDAGNAIPPTRADLCMLLGSTSALAAQMLDRLERVILLLNERLPARRDTGPTANAEDYRHG